MSKFKIGDQVTAYNDAVRRKGVVTGYGDVSHEYWVLCGGHSRPWMYHEKQLRRLKPKPAFMLPKRLLIHGLNLGDFESAIKCGSVDPEEWVKVRRL